MRDRDGDQMTCSSEILTGRGYRTSVDMNVAYELFGVSPWGSWRWMLVRVMESNGEPDWPLPAISGGPNGRTKT